MRVFHTSMILLAAPLLLTACNKAEAPAADATENTATTAETGNAMDAATPADVNNSGVAEMSSSGPGIIPGNAADADEGAAPAPAPAAAK